MKKILLTLFAIVVIIGVAMAFLMDDTATKFEYGQTAEGIEISEVSDNFLAAKQIYSVTATVKNTGSKPLDMVQITTIHKDAEGKVTGEAIGGPGKVLAPGESAVIETTRFIPESEKVPATVEIKAENL